MAISQYASFVALEAAAAVRDAATEIGGTLGPGLSGDAAALVFVPEKLAAAILAAIDEITDIELLGTLAGGGLTLPAVSGITTTLNRRQQSINQAALVELVRGAATITLAQRTTQTTFQDRTRAVDARNRVG